jgi:protein TonB
MNSTGNVADELLSYNEMENDLARFCLEPDAAESKRTLAWVNSICLVYLMIGILGAKPAAPVISKRAAAEEAVPTVIEPLVTAPQTITPDSGEEMNEKPSEEGPALVAVTVDSPAVAFSVPTVGNVVVPMGMAAPPPANPMQGAVPVNAARIQQIGVTGVGGSRPAPPYPRESLLGREEGTVVLLLEADEVGKIVSATIKESSGYWRLDQATLDYVKRRWLLPPGKGNRMFEAPIVYQLK